MAHEDKIHLKTRIEKFQAIKVTFFMPNRIML